ncbi:hypothetical protein [Bacillus sp. FSL R12-0069]|uniref:hypothetical protein n=1 Tax=Bacillus sp. FSL R12-0069 TaxID=2975342 RepID=UPI0030F9A25C
MLKQKMMKVALCGALGIGVVGSMEALKPSTASAASYHNAAEVAKLDAGILTAAKQQFGPNAEIRNIINGNVSEKFIYITVGEPRDFFKCTATYPAISDGATSQVKSEDKISYGTDLKSELSAKLNVDTSIASQLLMGLKSVLNLSASASASANASYTTQYSTTHSIDKTITAPTGLGKSVIPAVFEHQSTQKVKLQRVNPDYINYVLEGQDRMLNGPQKPRMFKDNAVDQTLVYVNGKYFIGIERNSPMGNKIAFGGGIQGQEFMAKDIEASKQK